MTKTSNTSWVTGTPRTGSMLTYNLIREIHNSKGFCVLPREIPQRDEEHINLYKKTSINDLNEKNQYVFKVHMLLNPNLPRSKYIVNIRNPFDICASFSEFMKCDLNTAISVARSHWDIIQHYKSFDSSFVFFIRYEKLEFEPIKETIELSKFLDVDLDLINAQKIFSKFEKNTVKQLIKNTDAELKEKMLNEKEIMPKEIVKISDGNYRAFHLKTGFQTGHVSNRKSGEWKKAFNLMEIPKVIDALNDVAINLGYEKEVY